MPDFRERMWPPIHWWLLSGLGVVTVSVVLWSVLPTVLTIGVGALLLVAAMGALVAYALEIAVDETGLRAGRASLPWSAIGGVRALDAAAAAHLRGPGMDPRSHLALRGYVRAGVRVEVEDAADPTPYWYISTRRPDKLVSVLVARGRAPSA